MASCSVIVSTIGCPFLLESLASMQHPFEEVIVVLDRVGRSCSALDQTYPLADLEVDLAQMPWARLVFYDAPANWAVQNGAYNVGAHVAQSPWLLFTHDDVIWPEYDFPTHINPLLGLLESGAAPGVVGVVLPEWEKLNKVQVPNVTLDRVARCQCVSPVSQIIARSAYDAMGGFDEEFGIWYDGQLEHETLLRDWWYLYVPTPSLLHTSNRTYRANNWGDGWTRNPKWGNHQANFERKYGVPPAARKLSAVDPTLLDARFTL